MLFTHNRKPNFPGIFWVRTFQPGKSALRFCKTEIWLTIDERAFRKSETSVDCSRALLKSGNPRKADSKHFSEASDPHPPLDERYVSVPSKLYLILSTSSPSLGAAQPVRAPQRREPSSKIRVALPSEENVRITLG